MAQAMLETSIPAHDPSRVYYILSDGMTFDLPPGRSQKPQRYVLGEGTPNDPKRVYLHDTRDNIFWDVTPEVAQRYIHPVVFVGPEAIAALAFLLCPSDQ